MAHLRVLKALANCGINIDMTAGTGAGARIDASGVDPDLLLPRFLTNLRKRNGPRSRFRTASPLVTSLLDSFPGS